MPPCAPRRGRAMHISTLAEYDAAMARLDALMDAPEAAAEFRREQEGDGE